MQQQFHTQVDGAVREADALVTKVRTGTATFLHLTTKVGDINVICRYTHVLEQYSQQFAPACLSF